ncbi:MAG: TolC family protein [Bacteroidales bacterium]|nr:TolC family protein [Bacteroidales bacterium]
MKIHNKIVVALAVPAMLSMASCGIYGKYSTPEDNALTSEYAKAREAGPDSTQLGNLLWEDVFTDPMLVDLINQALENNTNLNNARSNVEIAQARLQGAKLAYLPSLALTPNGAGASYAGSDISWTYALQAAASWEVDIFGKLLNSKRGAKAALLQSEAYAQAVRSQIIAAVAKTYYSIAILERQIALYNSTSELWKESVQTMKDLKESGRQTEAAVVQSEANYYNILGGLTDLQVSLTELNSTMSLLLNKPIQDWDVPANATLELPVKLQDGVPMSCLAFRPDVYSSEMSLASAFYSTNSARSAFYPSVTISAQGGFTNLLGSFIKNPGDWFYQLAGSLTAPLFSRGQNIANLKAAKQQQQQALNNFEYTLLSAASEVHNGLVTYEKAVEKQEYLEQQVASLEKSVEYTNDLLIYSTGTYLEVLTAQQSLLSAQMSALSTEMTRINTIVNLYQAMGGGR